MGAHSATSIDPGEQQLSELARFLQARRQELQLSLVQLERRTGIHNARLSRYERDIKRPGHPSTVVALARGLEASPADLLALAGMNVPDELPSLRPYLRSKYGPSLPDEALTDIAEYSEQIAARYGATTGPLAGEDETEPPTTPENAATV